MSLRTYNKNLQRMYRANILRLFAIGFIIAIGIAFATGVGAVANEIRDAIASATNLNIIDKLTLEGIADKVELMGNILPPFFIAISMLVTSTTITRLIEEERPTIACYKTLGYSNFLIVSRYIVFSFTTVVIGCVLGILLGNFALRPAIFNAAASNYGTITAPGNSYLTQGIIWSIVMVVVIVLTALIASFTLSKKKPSELLRPKSPKAGKKIFLERICFFWKRLSFKFKSTFRNIFRFKTKLLMTVLSVAGSTIMLWIGLALFATIKGLESDAVFDAVGFADSINAIAAVVTVCGVLLAILVLFNLTNINIEERRREIATLKVLGYKQGEVAGFIYREVIILSVVGILLGLPSGYYFCGFIFNYLDFGSLSHILWYHWIMVVAIAFTSVIIANFLLYRKIKKIEMVSSLKTVE